MGENYFHQPGREYTLCCSRLALPYQQLLVMKNRLICFVQDRSQEPVILTCTLVLAMRLAVWSHDPPIVDTL